MICLASLDEPAREQVLAALFDPVSGAGFSTMKTVLAATDFMLAGPFYSYNDTPGDRSPTLNRGGPAACSPAEAHGFRLPVPFRFEWLEPGGGALSASL
jgi:hypothetical protein